MKQYNLRSISNGLDVTGDQSSKDNSLLEIVQEPSQKDDSFRITTSALL